MPSRLSVGLGGTLGEMMGVGLADGLGMLWETVTNSELTLRCIRANLGIERGVSGTWNQM